MLNPFPGLIASVLAVSSVVATSSSLDRGTGPTCTDFIATIHAGAPTKILPQPPANIADPTALLNFVTSLASGGLGGILGLVGSSLYLPTLFTQGDYKISMRYCEPQVAISSRANTIQLLVHGISYNKDYWNGLGMEEYSWVDYATKQGYPTLAIDNLGNGMSDHPDALIVTQQTIQVEVIHNIIGMLRAGTLPNLPKKFSKVLFVGHSYGSICGNALATHYPDDVDSFVLIGYSGRFAFGAFPLLEGAPAPAIATNPQRYSWFIDPLYFVQTLESGRTKTFYTNPSSVGGFAQSVADQDFATEGTFSIGEIATISYGLGPANDYAGSILAIAGKNDAVACNKLPAPDCGSGEDSVPAQAGKFFPKADYEVYIPDKTGHSVSLHYSAQESFKHAHDFFSRKGF